MKKRVRTKKFGRGNTVITKSAISNVHCMARPKRVQNSETETGVLPPVLQTAASRTSVSLPENVRQKESDDAPQTPPFLPTPAPLTATTPQDSFASPSSFPPAPAPSFTFYSSPAPLASSTESPSPSTKTLSRFIFSPSSSPPPPPPSSQVLPEDTFTPSRAGPVFPIRRLGERD